MLLVVAAWAFGEAILFFLVADIPISIIALRWGWKAGAKASLVAAIAATAGGLATYAWAASDPAGAERAIAALPAIDGALIALTRDRFEAVGYLSMLSASATGVPYKIYALAAGSGGSALLPFALLSPLIRLPRFLIVAAVTAGAGRLLSRWMGMRARIALLSLAWMLFYAWYFATMPG